MRMDARLSGMTNRCELPFKHRQRQQAKGADRLEPVRHEVAYAIALTSRKAGQETGRSVDRSLPVHALLATTTCEATGTTWLASGLAVSVRRGNACER